MVATDSSHAQFGKNKVQYDHQSWDYIQTPHFDIYFNDGGYDLAIFTAKEAEKAYLFITDEFRWNFKEDDRISVIVYNSHNDFEQTNVISESISEGTQGFTEFLKNRVVLQFEGSYEAYRHLIHHELTHGITNYYLFGSNIMSIIQGYSRTKVPLWFVEGLAEYESNFGMDPESDMYIRDMVVNSRLPELEYLDYYGYYGVYKGGQSVIDFIASTYGKEKIGELMQKVRGSRDLSRAVKNALGLEYKEFNRRWQQYVNKQHWVVGAETVSPIDFAEKITDHEEEEINYYDISPAISPQGDLLAYISNSSDYFDVYLYSLVENKRIKKLVSGERTKTFEELHIVRPGISWSPDAKYVVLASKAGGKDAISIVDVDESKVVRTISFELDGIFSPSWRPTGDEIAFVGINEGKSDIYIVNLNDGRLEKITDDVFTDLSPSWSPNGDRLVFISDRGKWLDPDLLPPDFDMSKHTYSYHNIYIADAESGWKLTRITNSIYREQDPVFASDSILIYSSDENGIFNFYKRNLDTDECYAITNVVTGCQQPSVSRDGKELVFASIYNMGYDIYLMSDPLDPKLHKDLVPTALREKIDNRAPIEVPEPFVNIVKEAYAGDYQRPYKNFVFDYRRRNISEARPVEPIDTTKFKTEEGEFVVNKYKVKFTTDYIYASAYFSSVWGARGVALAHFSDILGNHNFYFLTDLQNRIEVSNYLFGYSYLPRRIDFGINFYHFVYYFSTDKSYYTGNYYTDRDYFRDRDFGVALTTSYPLSKFTRFEFNTDFVGIDREVWDFNFEEYNFEQGRRMVIGELAYVHDTSVGRYFGPMNGKRLRLSLLYSPNLFPDADVSSKTRGLDFSSIIGDYRKYLKVGRDYSLALRATGGASFGDQPQQFFIGGVTNWINRPYRIDVDMSDIEDIYVARFVTPFRGGGLYERVGDRFFLTNVEFRFPFIQYLIFGWPIPYPFYNVRGALFSDFGAAWNDESGFDFMAKDEDGNSRLATPIWGFGFGMRFPFPFIGWPTKWDVAWQTDIQSVTKPRYYLSLGYEF